MKAIIKSQNSLELEDIDQAKLQAEDHVLVKVECVGLCRTDLMVAQGKIIISGERILGHECSGRIIEMGAAIVPDIFIGQQVSVIPQVSCQVCNLCKTGFEENCPHAVMMGVDVDGTLCEYLSIPVRQVLCFEKNIDPRLAAYTEPVAAALAITTIPLSGMCLIYGKNRFAALIEQIITLKTHAQCEIIAQGEAQENIPENYYDIAVETYVDQHSLPALVRSLKPGGLLILRARIAQNLNLNRMDLIRKQIQICAVNYGKFNEAVELLQHNLIDLNASLGNSYHLNDFHSAFAEAQLNENKKQFIQMA